MANKVGQYFLNELREAADRMDFGYIQDLIDGYTDPDDNEKHLGYTLEDALEKDY